jgi:ubiquinone/menaquinone biosynthesis C-methylase UbiE
VDKNEKLNRIIEILDNHIRGAGDMAGVEVRTETYLEKYIYPRLKPEWKCLDCGAGDCATQRQLGPRIDSWTGINKGIDQFNCKDNNGTIEMDFHNLEFDNNSFDLVISVNTLEHAYFPTLMLFEMNRVSNEYVYIQMPVPGFISGLPYDNHPDHYYVCSDLCWENLFSKLGFSIVDKGIAGGEYQWLLKKTKDWY